MRYSLSMSQIPNSRGILSRDLIVALGSWDDFMFTLPGGGSDSTLKNRLESVHSKVKAKTGGLSGVSCLSGYIFSEKYGPVAFSMLMNGYIGNAAPFRKLQDRIVATILYD